MKLDRAHTRGRSWIHPGLLTLLVLLSIIWLLILLPVVLLLVLLLVLLAIILLLLVTIILLFVYIVTLCIFSLVTFFGATHIEKSIICFVIVRERVSVLLLFGFSLVLIFFMLIEIELRTILLCFVHLTFQTIIVILSRAIRWPYNLFLFRSTGLGFSSASCTLAWPHSFWFLVGKDIYTRLTPRSMVNLHWGFLLIPISKIVLSLWSSDLIASLFLVLVVFVIALWLSITRTWAWCIIVILTHVIPITILVWLLISITIVLLISLRLLLFVVAPTDWPLTPTTRLMMDFYTRFVVFRVIMLVHFEIVRFSLHFFLCSLLCSEKFTISFRRGALIHSRN